MSILKVDSIVRQTDSSALFTPYFKGELASSVAITRATETQITGLTANELDSDSAFDGSIFTVPSGKGGVYMLGMQTFTDFDGIGDDGMGVYMKCKKTPSGGSESVIFGNNNFMDADTSSGGDLKIWGMNATTIVELAAGDVLKWYYYSSDRSGDNATLYTASGDPFTQVWGFKMGFV